jgi:predicted phosphodiesterase
MIPFNSYNLKIKQLINQGFNNTDIAKNILGIDNMDFRLQENLRIYAGKIRRGIVAVEEPLTDKEQKLKKLMANMEAEYGIRNKERVLVIGDTHAPYTHKDYLNFCYDLYMQFQCTKVVHIGDVVDNHAISYHESNPDLMGAGDELDEAIHQLKSWYRLFPNVDVCIGNHDSLISRKTMTMGLPAKVMKSLGELLELQQWSFKKEIIIDNILYQHGTKISWAKQGLYSYQRGMSTVMGHLHSEASIKHLNNNIYTARVGCGIDFTSPAYDYVHNSTYTPVISAMVIKEGYPMLFVM